MPLQFKLLKSTKDMSSSGSNLLYSVSSPLKGAIIRNIRFYNNAASTNVTLKVGNATNVTACYRFPVLFSSTAVFNTEITLKVGEKVEASTAVSLDCVVCGAEVV